LGSRRRTCLKAVGVIEHKGKNMFQKPQKFGRSTLGVARYLHSCWDRPADNACNSMRLRMSDAERGGTYAAKHKCYRSSFSAHKQNRGLWACAVRLVWLEVLKAASMKKAVFWLAATCSQKFNSVSEASDATIMTVSFYQTTRRRKPYIYFTSLFLPGFLRKSVFFLVFLLKSYMCLSLCHFTCPPAVIQLQTSVLSRY
jgi:hypothetical protein